MCRAKVSCMTQFRHYTKSSWCKLLLQEYPAWWPNDFANVRNSPPKGSQSVPARGPTRLANSMQSAQPNTAPLWSNDLVTTQYLNVPSSGYANQATNSNATLPRHEVSSKPGLNSRSPASRHVASDVNKENTGSCHKWICVA